MRNLQDPEHLKDLTKGCQWCGEQWMQTPGASKGDMTLIHKDECEYRIAVAAEFAKQEQEV